MSIKDAKKWLIMRRQIFDTQINGHHRSSMIEKICAHICRALNYCKVWYAAATFAGGWAWVP